MNIVRRWYWMGLTSSGDSASPVVQSIIVNNTTPNELLITLNDLSTIDVQTPQNNQWTITGTAATLNVTAQVVNSSAKTVTLTLNSNIVDSDTPLVSYINPNDSTGIKDSSNNYLGTFSNYAVTNNTGILPSFSGNPNLQWLFTSTGFSGTSTVEDRSGNNNDGLLVKSYCLTSNGTTVLTFSSLTGITITSWEGTSTLTKSGNTITTTSGTFYNILLSNGTHLPCAEGSGNIVYDSVNSLNGTISGTLDWTSTQNTYHYNIRNGFSHLGRMDAINQYVTLTSNILFSTGKFSIKVIYAPDNIATTQDLLGTATTANQFAIGSSAGAITGTLRLGSGTTYALTCAGTAAAVGYANNTFSTIIFSRDALGVVTATLNGFTLLINGSASVTDASSTTISLLMRTSTSNSNIGILKEVEILDHSTTSLIGTKYNADNSFQGTLSGGFTLRKYPKPQGGDASNRNTSGNWHNGAETLVKPNPLGNATLQTATGWTSSTELSYGDLSSTADPSFCNVLNPIRKRNLVSWTNALAYEDELVANNFVGKTTININNITGWSSSNRLAYTAGSNYNATTAMTVKVVVKPIFITTSMVIFGKTNAVGGNGWAVELLANAAGSDLSLRVRDGSNAVKNSRYVAFSEKEDDISIYHFVIRDGFMYSYRNGHKENTAVAISGITTSTDDLIIGALSGGSAFTGGILATALYESKGMTDNEVEASYQATKNNVYVQEDGITLLFGSESGNANWIDRVSGTVTMTKSGTLTVASITQVFNYRWRPEDWPSTSTPSSLTTLTTPTIRIDGDSRVVGGFSENGVGFRQGLYDLIQLDSDISGATFIGSQGSAPIQHYGFNGKTSGTLLSEPPGILISNGTYPADIIVNFIGTNAMTTETLFNNELADWETLMFSYKRDIPNVRFVIVGETEHNDAIRRARSQDLMYQKMIQITKLREKGYNIIFVNPWRTLKIQDNDFIDVVHPNDQGNTKLDDLIYYAIRLSTNHSGTATINPLLITDQYWAAKHNSIITSYKDTAKTIIAVDGEGVQCLTNLVGTSDLDFDGTTTGQAQIQAGFDYGATDPYPKFHNKDGGFIQLLNSTAQRFQSSPNFSPSYSECSVFWLMRMTGGTDNEYFNFITNGLGFRDRDEGTGNSTQLGYTTSSGNIGAALRVLVDHVYKLAAIEIYRDASGNAQMYVNGTAYGSPVSIGTSSITEFAFGSNAHNATLSFYAGAFMSGSRDTTKINQLLAYWEDKYASFGSYPSDFPYITFDGGGSYSDKETWNSGDTSINAASYTFRSPEGKLEGATEFRLYGSSSSTQATAIGQKTLIATKIKGVDANPGKFIKGVDYTTANVWYWIEVVAVDVDGGRQPFATNGGGILSP